MRGAAAALADARAATARAEAARRAADEALASADASHAAARADLAVDPAEAERLLALLDAKRFRQTMARGAVEEAEAAEQAHVEEEAVRRKAMILAQARHDVLAERLGTMRHGAERRRDEHEAMDAEDSRRFR